MNTYLFICFFSMMCMCACRWKVDFGKAWELLGGESVGQTQIAYPQSTSSSSLSSSSSLPFNHPLDLHFAEAGIQVHIHTVHTYIRTNIDTTYTHFHILLCFYTDIITYTQSNRYIYTLVTNTHLFSI